MKKISYMFFAIILCLGFIVTASAKELTLNELQAQAKANREAYNNAKAEKALTEKEKAEATAEKQKVNAQIQMTKKEIEGLEDDIEELKKEIEIKDKEIKKIMNFVQISNGESAYLEYAFGASSFTDFIYRVSVAEQLSNYNDELIREYNQHIKELTQKQKDLTAKEQELIKKEQELTVLEAKLNKEIASLQHGMISKDEEYKTQINLINSMLQRGCKGSDTPTSCQKRLSNSSTLVSTNGTYMPIAKGRVTSDYGKRDLDGDGYKEDTHTGIDFSNSIKGDTIYPIADGQVILKTYNRSCGNNIVYVKHNINGHSYITSYWHLRSASVKVGQLVTYKTKIGEMGGYDSADQCSKGTHVHLNLFDNANNKWENRVANGGNPNSGRINPRTIMPQTPAKGSYFTR